MTSDMQQLAGVPSLSRMHALVMAPGLNLTITDIGLIDQLVRTEISAYLSNK